MAECWEQTLFASIGTAIVGIAALFCYRRTYSSQTTKCTSYGCCKWSVEFTNENEDTSSPTQTEDHTSHTAKQIQIEKLKAEVAQKQNELLEERAVSERLRVQVNNLKRVMSSSSPHQNQPQVQNSFIDHIVNFTYEASPSPSPSSPHSVQSAHSLHSLHSVHSGKKEVIIHVDGSRSNPATPRERERERSKTHS